MPPIRKAIGRSYSYAQKQKALRALKTFEQEARLETAQVRV